MSNISLTLKGMFAGKAFYIGSLNKILRSSNSIKPVVRPFVRPFFRPSGKVTFGPEGPLLSAGAKKKPP